MTNRTALLPILAAFVCLSCGDTPTSGTISYTHPMDPEKRAAAVEVLGTAPMRVQDEIYKTCDKWHHIDHPCLDADVRTDAMRCWHSVGIKEMEHANKIRIRPRAYAMKILRVVNVCLEQAGWRKNKAGPDF